MKNVSTHFVRMVVLSDGGLKTVIGGLFALELYVLSVAAALAGGADVLEAAYARSADGTYRFDVTVRHEDAGWEHYADKWQVLDADGTVLGERVLFHPHDTEQPFTRSQSGIEIPIGVQSVVIRAHDKKHGWGGAELTIELEN
ncbi:hypothetical protein [Hoeflea sp.]|uniref:hypothetical protein n=1 Tax=Hoeflea sp. TaxID=1940281 RepID=UPI003748A2C5